MSFVLALAQGVLVALLTKSTNNPNMRTAFVSAFARDAVLKTLNREFSTAALVRMSLARLVATAAQLLFVAGTAKAFLTTDLRAVQLTTFAIQAKIERRRGKSST